MTKQCSKCKEDKDINSFGRRTASKDGFKAQCKPCAKEYLEKWRPLNKDKIAKHNKTYYGLNVDKIAIKGKIFYDANTRKRIDRTLAWQKANPEKANAKSAAWNKANPAKTNAVTAKYRASKMQRTPKWLTKEDFKRMQRTYRLAKIMTNLTGVPYHVDHIVPLQGDNVSGLHVPMNLKAIPASRNISKGNRFNA